MTFLDPRAMIECRLVSKYWRHHAIKPNIEAAIIRGARARYDYTRVGSVNNALLG